ncbi:MAG TPA: UPF0182 family protein [Bryobacteraceae bacterium]|jgi:hypothetical protein
MPRIAYVAATVALLFILALTCASTVIEYSWWHEMGQVDTWLSMATYRYLPRFAGAVLLFALLRFAYAQGRRIARSLEDVVDIIPAGNMLANLGIAILSLIVAWATIDAWIVAQFFGGRNTAAVTAWSDPIFGKPLSFYFFELPFYRDSISFLLTAGILTILVYYASSIPFGARTFRFEFSKLARIVGAFVLVVYAADLYFERYQLVLAEHSFLTGADYVDEHIRLPLAWLAIGTFIVMAILLVANRYMIAGALIVVALVPKWIVPPIVSTFYVKPNEISLERPYIERHITATRTAYGIEGHSKESEFPTKPDAKIDFARNRTTFDNVRLWDRRAFIDTITQIQPLRPYIYDSIDVDRYNIDGTIRQVLVSPRNLELEQLGDAGRQWINKRFTYTHGYGLVLAEANRITSSGLPVLFIQNAPPEVKTSSLKVTQPDIYYAEHSHEPVFVDTAQPEFDYPSGNQNVHTHYKGTGGFPMSSLFMRLMASITYGEWNILLTDYLTHDSRMMIHRNITDRLDTLAGFITWDSDPYMVVSKEGRLIYIIDGYMTSSSHPYSAETSLQNGAFNYIRNSVKATVDAYDGKVHIYINDEKDPLIGAYRHLFPNLFEPLSAMPDDLQAHLRCPELMFQVQAEIYRIYHMRDSDNFYNKADTWDIARYLRAQGTQGEQMPPTYIIARLPGETDAEYLLVQSFTPHGKDNLIGYMAARCDRAHRGDLVFLQLSKQDVVLGPMQIEARIDQDQTISKDLSLWNQQGSQVVRGQMMVLPVDDTFVFVKPFYLQASNARMPQLKKIVIAAGSRLVYEDTYDQALASLSGSAVETRALPGEAASTQPAAGTTPAAQTSTSAPLSPRDALILEHLEKLRKDIDSLETELKKSQPKK